MHELLLSIKLRKYDLRSLKQEIRQQIEEEIRAANWDLFAGAFLKDEVEFQKIMMKSSFGYDTASEINKRNAARKAYLDILEQVKDELKNKEKELSANRKKCDEAVSIMESPNAKLPDDIQPYCSINFFDLKHKFANIEKFINETEKKLYQLDHPSPGALLNAFDKTSGFGDFVEISKIQCAVRRQLFLSQNLVLLHQNRLLLCLRIPKRLKARSKYG